MSRRISDKETEKSWGLAKGNMYYIVLMYKDHESLKSGKFPGNGLCFNWVLETEWEAVSWIKKVITCFMGKKLKMQTLTLKRAWDENWLAKIYLWPKYRIWIRTGEPWICSRQWSYFLKWAMGEISGFLKGNGDDHICILERFYKG